ncbi:hypothetical protein BOTBODRAFT_169100 [Botryobasidium botryosum FD-172 SS1]|uniref:Uncharacterized protein n=1 Tax=Botryobasidium botryosum (strain FD-172 SS1) TaxID=930990 RepID=A0A067N4P1_BOTB1|nr:hypothetical protein BOTBODRAFT_169100 [Botryobasidium botryosum FD-172 SS1]
MHKHKRSRSPPRRTPVGRLGAGLRSSGRSPAVRALVSAAEDVDQPGESAGDQQRIFDVRRGNAAQGRECDGSNEGKHPSKRRGIRGPWRQRTLLNLHLAFLFQLLFPAAHLSSHHHLPMSPAPAPPRHSPASSSPAASLSSSSTKVITPPATTSAKKRRFSPDELRRNLALLADLPRPLSPTLPPSPPQSRSVSPAPQSQPKRKRGQSEDDQERSSAPGQQDPKRSRIESKASPAASISSPHRPRAAATSHKPSAASPKSRASTVSTPPDDKPASSSATPPASQPRLAPPVKRARRHLQSSELGSLISLYNVDARKLKHSADARMRDSRANPRQAFLSRLEVTDSILHFMYSFWCADEQKHMFDWHKWDTTAALTKFILRRWGTETEGDVQKAMTGLFHLIEGCVSARIATDRLRKLTDSARTHQSPPSAAPTPTSTHTHPTPTSNPTPPAHIPSPASSASPTSSLNSNSPKRSPPLSPNFVEALAAQSLASQAASSNIQQGHAQLSSSLLARAFPRTFELCITSDIAISEGHTVDFKECARGQGTWAWPILGGESIVHLIGFARSLVWELGEQQGGYRGVEGCQVDY